MIQNWMRSYARGTKAALVMEIRTQGCAKRTFARGKRMTLRNGGYYGIKNSVFTEGCEALHH